MTTASKIPATVVTGFLGAGKTTLIRNLLASANGRRIALIINEFGDLGIDGDVLRGCGAETCREEDIVELTNGCICCTVADDFIPTITALLEREERPDHIVIETSGLALPQPLVRAFNWPEIRTRVTVDGVVTVVDSHAVANGRFADDEDAVNRRREADEALDHESPLEELFEDQIACADMIILNKADLVDEPALDSVKNDVIGRVARQVKVVKSRRGELGADILLGLGVGAEDDIEARRPCHELRHEGDGHDHDHDHDEFDTFAVTLGQIGNVEAFKAKLGSVIADHDILRLKGFVAVTGKPMRLVVQAVGRRIDSYFDREWRDGESRQTGLVVIGEAGLDREAIAARLGAA